MKLLVLLALCGAVALTPVERKPDNEEKVVTTTEQPPCDPQTPCGWSTYNPKTREILDHINNTYCYCPDSLSCVLSEDDTAVNGYIRRCRTKDTELDVPAR